MKKYHIADVLTLSRIVIFSSLLIFFTFVGVSSGWALFVFVIGELTDALDGIVARAWPYPKDGKRRWWRENERYQLFDKVADIILLVSFLFYIVFYLHWWVVAWISVAFGVVAIIVEIWRHFRIKSHGPRDKVLTKVVLMRRWAYVIGMFLLCLMVLWWPSTLGELLLLPFAYTMTKATLTIAGVIVAVAFIVVKKDRRSEDVTPLCKK